MIFFAFRSIQVSSISLLRADIKLLKGVKKTRRNKVQLFACFFSVRDFYFL